jgi:hypothetical protein
LEEKKKIISNTKETFCSLVYTQSSRKEGRIAVENFGTRATAASVSTEPHPSGASIAAHKKKKTKMRKKKKKKRLKQTTSSCMRKKTNRKEKAARAHSLLPTNDDEDEENDDDNTITTTNNNNKARVHKQNKTTNKQTNKQSSAHEYLYLILSIKYYYLDL